MLFSEVFKLSESRWLKHQTMLGKLIQYHDFPKSVLLLLGIGIFWLVLKQSWVVLDLPSMWRLITVARLMQCLVHDD